MSTFRVDGLTALGMANLLIKKYGLGEASRHARIVMTPMAKGERKNYWIDVCYILLERYR